MANDSFAKKPINFAAVGRGGWARVVWQISEPDKMIVADVRFRFQPPPVDRFEAVELHIGEDWLPRHRNFPLGRVVEAANVDGDLRDRLLEQLAKPGQAGAPVHPYDALGGKPVPMYVERLKSWKRFELKKPPGRRLPDDFFAEVARAYKDALAAGENPRKQLALDSGVPADTVARWISKARAKGELPPARPEKASA
jgi:hypothetical protein